MDYVLGGAGCGVVCVCKAMIMDDLGVFNGGPWKIGICCLNTQRERERERGRRMSEYNFKQCRSTCVQYALCKYKVQFIIKFFTERTCTYTLTIKIHFYVSILLNCDHREGTNHSHNRATSFMPPRTILSRQRISLHSWQNDYWPCRKIEKPWSTKWETMDEEWEKATKRSW